MFNELQKEFDVNSLNANHLWIRGEITEDYGMDLVQQMQHLLDQEEKPETITIYIDSCGGDCDQGFALIDQIEYAKSKGIKVITVGYNVSSIASVILFSGTKGYRYAGPSCRLMIHKPYWETDDESQDKKTLGWEIGIAKRTYRNFLLQYGNVSFEDVNKMLTKDYYMSAEQAKKYGWIDFVDIYSEGW